MSEGNRATARRKLRELWVEIERIDNGTPEGQEHRIRRLHHFLGYRQALIDFNVLPAHEAIRLTEIPLFNLLQKEV